MPTRRLREPTTVQMSSSNKESALFHPQRSCERFASLSVRVPEGVVPFSMPQTHTLRLFDMVSGAAYSAVKAPNLQGTFRNRQRQPGC
jgi:hypothetical protein